ncbi:MAG: starch-binding protein [Paludibacteraceae bacterium]|nr:starch-binding protein [Paludibacteraceae bacterium]
MKKILLLTTMLVASICAMAQNVTVYFVNDAAWETVNAYAWSPEPNDAWPGVPATLTSETCKGAAVYSFDVDYSKTTKIIFNNGSAQTDDLDIDPAKPYCYGGQWFATLAEIEGAGEIVAYFLHGNFASSDWASVALVENNGVWSIDALEVAVDANFGVKRTTNGLQDAWYWSVDGANVSATGSYQFGEEKTLTTGANASINAGTYAVSFDPATETLTITASDEGGEEGGEEGGDDPIDTPTGADYYLIGWINGADYGDKADAANLGEYKFVDGTLVATFTADSYVAIKNGDMTKWYFAEAYADASPVTLEAGKDFGEKMKVPGNVEVTFTLVENADGSLTLSYTTGTPTDLEDVDAEDAVVAAYDLLGRPVAADAAGYVILQYASGKAVKVFNN